MFRVFSVTILVLLCNLYYVESNSDLKVCYVDGCVQGTYEPGNLHSFNAWYGIPYASPPVGQLRFKSPRLPVKWKTVYDATYPRSQCMQLDIATRSPIGSEDCLFLNVFRPRRPYPNRSKLLPVLVFIHGGSFKGGSTDPSIYGADFLMDTQEVIVVTVQYRLGVFGFLAADHVSCKGNFALKDQNLALHWVHYNIEAFGGDRDAVTLMGQSAGAAAVQHQMISPRSNGLFQRAVMFSGSALAFWAIDKNPGKLFRQYAEIAGIPGAREEDPSTIVRQLKAKSAEELLLYQESIPILHPVLFVFRPVVERHWGGAFLAEDPTCIWRSGKYQQRPFLTGVTGYEEGAFANLFYNETLRQYLTENWEETMMAALDYPPSALAPIKDYYFGGKVTAENIINILRMRDRMFDFPLFETVDFYTKNGNLKKNPVQLYRFNFTSTISTASVSNPYPIEGRGASHSDDLLYLFRTRAFDAAFKGHSPEAEMRNFFTRFIVDYVRQGWSALNHVRPCLREGMERGFCDYLDIQRDFTETPNRVKVTATNDFELEMVRVHRLVESIIERERNEHC